MVAENALVRAIGVHDHDRAGAVAGSAGVGSRRRPRRRRAHDGRRGSVGGGPGAIDQVDKPFGRIIPIIPDHACRLCCTCHPCRGIRTTATRNRTSPHCRRFGSTAPMRTDPDSWEAWGTFEWTRIGRSTPGASTASNRVRRQLPDPSILYCTVSYSSRDRRLSRLLPPRDRGGSSRMACKPLSSSSRAVRIPEEWLPEPVEPVDPVEPANPAEPEKPQETAEGAADRREPARRERRRQRGNRGGVGQGGKRAERGERRTAEERRLPPRRETLSSKRPRSCRCRPTRSRPPERRTRRDARKRAPTSKAGRAGESDAASKESMPGKAFADSSTSRDSAATSAGSTSFGNRATVLPGFALAIGGTIGAMALISASLPSQEHVESASDGGSAALRPTQRLRRRGRQLRNPPRGGTSRRRCHQRFIRAGGSPGAYVRGRSEASRGSAWRSIRRSLHRSFLPDSARSLPSRPRVAARTRPPEPSSGLPPGVPPGSPGSSARPKSRSDLDGQRTGSSMPSCFSSISTCEELTTSRLLTTLPQRNRSKTTTRGFPIETVAREQVPVLDGHVEVHALATSTGLKRTCATRRPRPPSRSRTRPPAPRRPRPSPSTTA